MALKSGRMALCGGTIGSHRPEYSHESKYLDEMLNDLENNTVNKATHYLLIAEMYKNKNDNENSAKYYKLYNEYMESKSNS